MGTLSKEIEKIDKDIEQIQKNNWVVGGTFPEKRRQLVSLMETYPYLDHPATPFVEEMEKLFREYQYRYCERACQEMRQRQEVKTGHTELCQVVQAFLQKIKEAE